ncbi:MAG TPA: shikimate dehydrogenase [Dongiaceae bacterium]|nr:shikimate dehydrogenase [Dongiaceae bacterium]
MDFELSRHFAYKQRVPELTTAAINAATRYCAVLGHPIRHSASPVMQNAGIEALGLNWRYLAYDVHPDQLHAAIAGAKAMKFIGLNLTVPHKLLAVEMMDVLDASAQTWGAVNTVRFEACDTTGKWLPVGAFPGDVPDELRTVGYNTDADAIAHSVESDLQLSLAGASVLLLGAGGAGRTAALKLAAAGVAQLFLVNRTAAKAEAVAEEIRKRFPAAAVTVGYPNQPVDLAINATSLGLDPNDGALPYDPKTFSLEHTRSAYDMIYRPAETNFLRAARAAGCKTANGLGMLLHQGAAALPIWSGQPAPVEAMHTALRQNVYGS